MTRASTDSSLTPYPNLVGIHSGELSAVGIVLAVWESAGWELCGQYKSSEGGWEVGVTGKLSGDLSRWELYSLKAHYK